MNEDKQPIDFSELIPKYLSGNASDSEVERLEAWVLSAPENKAQFNQFKKTWMLSGVEDNYQLIDVNAEWAATANQLFPKDNVVSLSDRTSSRSVFFRNIAAAAVVLIFASVLLFRFFNDGKSLEVIAQNKIAESQLPDGTQVALNQYSSLKFSHPKDKNFRRVVLTGDAFFEVKRDTVRPFVITAQDVEVEVLGTAFYVDSRQEQPQVQVIVQSGVVAMSVGNEKVILRENEIGIYTKATRTLVKGQNEDANYMAWKTNVLTFNDASLESVVFALERKFHASISIADPLLNACEITATYENKSLDSIIRIIEKTLAISTERKDAAIIFSGKGCNE